MSGGLAEFAQAHRAVTMVVSLLVVAGLPVLILRGVPRLMDRLADRREPKRPLAPGERALLALVAHYGILNGMSDEHLGGLTAGQRQWAWSALAREWSIKGLAAHKRALAASTLEWLLGEGLRADEERAARAVAKHGPEAGRKALEAWDYSRLCFVARLCFFAGYIDEATAWRYLRAAAARLGGAFDSWASYGEALVAGRAIGYAGASGEFEAAVRRLREDPASSWGRISWAEAVAG